MLQVKVFDAMTQKSFEQKINTFLLENQGKITVRDIKFSVPGAYCALIIFESSDPL